MREWLKAKRDTKSRATALKYEVAIEKFIQSMGPRAQINLRQVLPRDLLRWRESEIASGKHPGACNDYLMTRADNFGLWPQSVRTPERFVVRADEKLTAFLELEAAA